MSKLMRISLGIVMVTLLQLAIIIHYYTFKELLTMEDNTIIIVGTFLGYMMVKVLIWGISALVMLIKNCG